MTVLLMRCLPWLNGTGTFSDLILNPRDEGFPSKQMTLRTQGYKTFFTLRQNCVGFALMAPSLFQWILKAASVQELDLLRTLPRCKTPPSQFEKMKLKLSSRDQH